jgi:hypothetical protein
MNIQSPNSNLQKIANDQTVPHPSPLPGGCVTINERPFWLQVGTGGQVTKLWTCLRGSPPCGTKAGRKPFIGQPLCCKPMKTLQFREARLPITLNDRTPKLRSLIPPWRDSVRIYPPSRLRHSLLGGEGWGEGFSMRGSWKRPQMS